MCSEMAPPLSKGRLWPAQRESIFLGSQALCAGKYDLCDSDHFLPENLRYKLMEVRYSGLESIVKKIEHNMT